MPPLASLLCAKSERGPLTLSLPAPLPLALAGNCTVSSLKKKWEDKTITAAEKLECVADTAQRHAPAPCARPPGHRAAAWRLPG